MGAKKKINRREFLKTTGSLAVGSAAFSMGLGLARAQPAEVKIGVIYPLSGSVAHAGKMSRDAVDLCVDYVNNKWPDLPIPIGQ
jgi:ABC-type branched-subunit amino acid transport system substrate-binding protein